MECMRHRSTVMWLLGGRVANRDIGAHEKATRRLAHIDVLSRIKRALQRRMVVMGLAAVLLIYGFSLFLLSLMAQNHRELMKLLLLIHDELEAIKHSTDRPTNENVSNILKQLYVEFPDHTDELNKKFAEVIWHYNLWRSRIEGPYIRAH